MSHLKLTQAAIDQAYANAVDRLFADLVRDTTLATGPDAAAISRFTQGVQVVGLAHASASGQSRPLFDENGRMKRPFNKVAP